MKFVSLPRTFRLRKLSITAFALLLLLGAPSSILAQSAPQQLSLADILIALRSKKVTLEERNKILTDAVKTRGITFAISSEIEKELANTGADKDLIEAIKVKSPVMVVATKPTPQPTPQSTPSVVPQTTPTPPDYTFYQKRGNAYASQGDYDLAISDLTRAISLNPKEVSLYLNRGVAFQNKQDFDLAITDFDKAIELNPKESFAFYNRGETYEKSGDLKKAAADFQKAVDLDASNGTAKKALQRVQDELAKASAPTQQPTNNEPTTATAANTEPFDPSKPVNLGQLNNLAVRLAKPMYPGMAQRANIQGVVMVQVTIDENGEVISAKATNGHGLLRSVSEDAARKSEFKPTVVNNQKVKATGVIVYNFVNKM